MAKRSICVLLLLLLTLRPIPAAADNQQDSAQKVFIFLSVGLAAAVTVYFIASPSEEEKAEAEARRAAEVEEEKANRELLSQQPRLIVDREASDTRILQGALYGAGVAWLGFAILAESKTLHPGRVLAIGGGIAVLTAVALGLNDNDDGGGGLFGANPEGPRHSLAFAFVDEKPGVAFIYQF